jgi:hypothetical protein
MLRYSRINCPQRGPIRSSTAATRTAIEAAFVDEATRASLLAKVDGAVTAAHGLAQG